MVKNPLRLLIIFLGCILLVGCASNPTICPKCAPCKFYYALPQEPVIELLITENRLDKKNVQIWASNYLESLVAYLNAVEVIKAYQASCEGKPYTPKIYDVKDFLREGK